MEDIRRWSLIAAFAPIMWGTAYYVTKTFLPADYPLYGALIRALPAGLILLSVARSLPKGSWWWRSAILGTLNVGAFFILVYLAAQLLPSSVAATVMALSPMLMMLIAWPMLRQKPRMLPLAGAVLGFAGVVLMVASGSAAANPVGLLASGGAMLMTSFGYILTIRWSRLPQAPAVLPATAWQLTAGGLLLIPFAVIIEGAPPTLVASQWLGFAFLTIMATALAYLAWFAGLSKLQPGTLGLIGLLNPITGVIAGALLAHERLSAPQLIGIAVVFSGIVLGQLAPAGTKSPRPAQEPLPATGVAGNPYPGSETRPTAHH